jgi:hypothetical protein
MVLLTCVLNETLPIQFLEVVHIRKQESFNHFALIWIFIFGSESISLFSEFCLHLGFCWNFFLPAYFFIWLQGSVLF